MGRVGDSHQGEIAGNMDYAEDQSMQQNTLVQAKHAAKVGTGSSFFDFLQQLLPFLLNLVHLQKIFFDLFSALAVKFTDPRDFLLELFIFPLLEQVYRVFFDEVRKCDQQSKQRHEWNESDQKPVMNEMVGKSE